MKQKVIAGLPIIILLLFGFLTRFIFFGYPAEVVFDEVTFVPFVADYFSGNYFFDVHPPLGKLILAFFVFVTGHGTDFHTVTAIGDPYANNAYLFLRFIPTLAGALLPLVVYGLCRILNFSKRSSFVAGLLVVFENSLVVHSRFILFDSLMLLFGFLGLAFFFLYKKRLSFKFLILSGLLLGAAVSIKWTALSFVGLVLVYEVVSYLKRRDFFAHYLKALSIFIISTLIVYVGSFAIHFALLPKTGQGDVFMSSSFQKNLEGNLQYSDSSSVSFVNKFTELNTVMWNANKTLTASHPYSSLWWQWPIMNRSIYYWEGDGEVGKSRIYLLGNPFIYWISLVGFLGLILFLIVRKVVQDKKGVAYFLLLGFIANLLPFILIQRVMFAYHYFPALIFAILITAFLYDQIQIRQKTKLIGVGVVMLVIFVAFIYFSPLTYGLPLSEESYHNRVWISSWE